MAILIINEGHVATHPVSLTAVNRIPAITQIYGANATRKRRATRCKQASASALELTFQTETGDPCDLSAVAYNSVAARFRENVRLIGPYEEAEVEVVHSDNGIVRAVVPANILAQAGIYLAEFALLNGVGQVMQSNECYLFVENSAWGQQDHKGPPMTDEIRLGLRDSDPIENELLGAYDYDLAEHCYACTRAVLDWNEQPPILTNYTYDSRNFPFRDIWINGIQLYLFQLAEEHYRRNALPYSAGGVNLDDKNRHTLYNQAWKERQAEWHRMIQHQKITCNINQGFRTIGSNYPR